MDWCKLNFDGSVNITTGVLGVGGIIRQHSGIIIAAYSLQINVVNPFDAELQALLQGLILSRTYHIR